MIRLIQHLREEWRLMRASSWGGGVYHNRATPVVQANLGLEAKRDAARQRMRELGIKGPRVPISSLAWEERHYRFARRMP